MTGASLADYEAAYRRAKGTGVIGAASIREDTTAQPIRAALAAGPIETRAEAQSTARRAFGYLTVHCNCGLDISVPAGYEQNTIRCIRCGSQLPVPTAAPSPMTAPSQPSEPPVIVPLTYHRTGTQWESFRCACGRTLQLSPTFAAPFLRCNACGRQINVTG